MKKLFVSILFLSITLLFLGRAFSGIETSKHNLSVTGTGDIRATTETQICVFCHIPHNASPSGPLWNREDPGVNYSYTLYESSTLDAASPPEDKPTGASLLCLSCHDGMIALGDLLSRDDVISMSLGDTIPAERRSNLGTDLSDDHPISIEYTESLAMDDGQLVSPSLLTGAVKLDRYSRVQCTSCHDPHDDTYNDFLVMDAVNGALCETCHIIFHSDTKHKTSTKTYKNTNPWPNTDWNTVQENACFNCHTPHAAAGHERLLKDDNEEEICLVCHDGNVAEYDLRTVFQKTYSHPLIDKTGEHDPTEPIIVESLHVECQDCHNGHAALPDTGDDDPSGTLNEVAGIDFDPTSEGIDPLTNEYQLCFRCHGYDQTQAFIYTSRLVDEPDLSDDFVTTNPSYHPVAATGQNNNVPSLIAPLSETSIIKCTDCHNNNDLNGPRGPHGSDIRPLLELEYITDDGTPESPTVYALCYKCHDRVSILENESFPRHSKHITGTRSGQAGGSLNTPCNVCHDPHGVRPDGGIGGLHSGTKLINFDTGVVVENSAGLLYYESTAAFEGACYLSCHGKDHNPCSYTSTGASCGSGPGGGGGGGQGGGVAGVGGGPGSGGGGR